MRMEFRIAERQDLPQIKQVYKALIDEMNRAGIEIWDDCYPCEFFEEDICRNRLYVLLDGAVITAAFALCDTNQGTCGVDWQIEAMKAVYIDRLGVNPKYIRSGIGSLMLEYASQLAKQAGANCLRLFVVDSNEPAIRLYEKNGFSKAAGYYLEVIEEDVSLREYGYEKKL